MKEKRRRRTAQRAVFSGFVCEIGRNILCKTTKGGHSFKVRAVNLVPIDFKFFILSCPREHI